MPDTPSALNNVITIDDERIKSHRSNDAAHYTNRGSKIISGSQDN
jgi:hypothetical protein